jgi:type I restriction enzyme S subunit
MSFARYPAYKDSGVPWLGEVPEHWEVSRLGRALVVQNGKDYKDIETDEGVPVIGSGGQFAWATQPMYTGQSVLFGRKGTVDKPLYIDGAFWTVDTMFWSKILPPNSAVFLYYLATTIPYSLYATSTALPSMTKASLHGHPVALPDACEQTQIAAFLDFETARIDALIAEQERLMELLREKRQAVISHAVTRGLDPTVPMKDSGVPWLGEIPAHWEVKALKSVSAVRTGVAKGKDLQGQATVMVPYLRVANVQDGFLDLSDVAEIEIPARDLNRLCLEPGDVLMNEGGDYDKLGRGCIWSGQIHPCITQNHVFAVRPRSVSSEWLNLYTSSRAAQFYFMSRSKQSTNLASISSTNLMELPVPLPPRSEQQVVVDLVTARLQKLDVMNSESAQAIALLQERRAALIAAAVTGQIDVRGWGPPEAA